MAKAKLGKSPGHGKKIAVFPFDVEQQADGRVIERKIEITVYMQSKYAGSNTPPLAVSAVQFMLVCEDEVEYGTDLNTCLKAMRGKLDLKYRIAWEQWLLVRVEPERYGIGDGAGLSLRWTEVWRGVTLDGDILLREFNRHGEFNNKWQISPWPETHKDKNGKTVACVMATEENRQALEMFAQKLRDLTKTLADFVSPDKIEESLRLIMNNQMFISGPSGEIPEITE